MPSKLTFSTAGEAEDFIIANPQRCKTTQYMAVYRVGSEFYITVWNFNSQPTVRSSFSHYLAS